MSDQQKTAKITRTTFVSEWVSPQGQQVYYHSIELDNGDSGQIGSKEKMPSKLNPGQELTYTIESTSRGNKIKAVQDKPQFKGKPQRDPREQMISFAMAYSRDLVVAGKIELGQMNAYFEKIYDAMISKL